MDTKLFNKNGYVSIQLAKMFITIEVGSRIPTFSELVESLDVARGTVQNSMELLVRKKAISLEKRGHLGTFLLKKNIDVLLDIAMIHYIAGVMPLPYSKRYEGLATGIIASVQNELSIPVNMSYMQGAKKRISMLISNRYDFAIVSEYAAKESIKVGDEIRIIKNFGPNSYLSAHVLAFHDTSKTQIEDGMKVGIDVDSIDQENITRIVAGNANVEYVKLGYNQIISKILNKEIDVALWNEDELIQFGDRIHLVPIQLEDSTADTTAVIVINNLSKDIDYLIRKIVKIEQVLDIQGAILDNTMIPNY